ncbi:hypothetical protein K2173_023361 [Erythroxylum novogranatense]|uniref:DUF241 domain protein n=1 Tax=Erythroxylum novogranatense TaxID=1862640 RepID=A0AAV8TVN5_9ROSI|nr:hypothetical protein K2173_023361 [Erythroxylum novogranatense]
MVAAHHVRSISLPSRSHPSAHKVEEELNKLRTWEASSTLTSTSGPILIGLAGIADLCSSMDDLLNMASIQEVLSRHKDELCMNELLDRSVKFLDICGIARDVMLQFKEQIRSLQSVSRRRKGDSTIESILSSYTCFRKKMNKEAKRLIASLKHINNKLGNLAFSEQDKHFSAMIQMLREVDMINICVLKSVLTFFSTPISNSKQIKWSFVSKLMHKGMLTSEEKQEDMNELENVDAVLCDGFAFKKKQRVQEVLEALEIHISDIENGLERVFRCLIKTRVSMLNIFSR